MELKRICGLHVYAICVVVLLQWTLTEGQFMETTVSESDSLSDVMDDVAVTDDVADVHSTSEELPELEDTDDRCYDAPYLWTFCSVPDDMVDLTFWDVYSVMFSDSVIKALVDSCDTGMWCLQDRFDFWNGQLVERAVMVMKSRIASGMCRPEVMSCFDSITDYYKDCDVHDQIQFTTEAINLICHLRDNVDLDQQCMNQTLISLHVTVADVIRENKMPSETDDTEGMCQAAEVHMTRRLICMENSCPGEELAFMEFQPWLWFTELRDGLIKECKLDPTKCVDVTKPLIEDLYTEELGLVVGGSIAVAVLVAIMALLACTLYRRHRRNAVIKDGYQKLLSDGDES